MSAHSVRNGWLCACFSSLREPEYSRAPTWIRRKVWIHLFILLDNSPPIHNHSYVLSGRALSESRIPCGYFKLLSKREYVLPFYTEPQTSANSKAKFWPRGMYNARLSNLVPKWCFFFSPEGRMLGGCKLFPAVYLPFVIDSSCCKVRRLMLKCSSAYVLYIMFNNL